MNPYLPPQHGPPPFQAQPVPNPTAFNRQKGRKQSYHQKNHHNGPGQRKGQSCYNCGSLEHWAQHCTEPRRPVPAGSNHNRPQKRQKTAPGPGMMYGTPHGHHAPHGHHPPPPGPPHGYPHSTPMGPTYPPAPTPHGLPTPMSAQSPHFNQWQHQSPPPYYPPRHPPYGGHALPAPGGAYGGQYPSPASPDGMPSHGPYPPPQYPYEPQGYSRKSYDYGQPHEDYSPRQESWPPRRPSEEVPQISPPVEPWLEELQSLDIDDSRAHGGEVVWHPPQPVARPLPSKLTSNDEVVNLPPLTSLPPGMSVSKYFLNKRAEEFLCHIRDTSDWPFIMKDPVFLTISVECETVPVSELVSRRKKLLEHHRVKTPEVPDTVEEPMDDQIPSERSPESEYDSSRRGSLASNAEDRVPDQAANGEELYEQGAGSKYEDEYSQVEANREPRNDSHGDQFPEPSHAMYHQSSDHKMEGESHSGDHDYVPEKFQNRPKHHGNQNKKSRGDRRGNAPNFRGQGRGGRGSRGSTLPRASKQNTGTFKDENNESPVHVPEGEPTNGHGESTNGRDDQPKPATRKRHRDKSPGDKSPRRQKDDSVSKNKIRRPQVAAAYSRRW